MSTTNPTEMSIDAPVGDGAATATLLLPMDEGADAAAAHASAQDTHRIVSSARWFWWIAGLSLVNTVMAVSGSDTSFVMGLAMTAVSDALFEANRAIGFGIDALVLAFFVAIGWQATRMKAWAFYVGVAVYVLDALIYAAFQDWMPVAFHALAIWFIAKGIVVLRARNRGA